MASQVGIDQTLQHYSSNPYDDDEEQNYFRNSISNVNAAETFGSVYGYKYSMASNMGRYQAVDTNKPDKTKANLLFISKCLPDFTPIQKN